MKRFGTVAISACLILALWSAPAASSAAEPTDDRAVIEKTIRAVIGWGLTKDRPLLESIMAHDDRLFLFNPDSQSTVGWGQFRKGFDFWMDSRFRTIRFDIRNLRLDISQSGSVAWWSCLLDELAAWDGRFIHWKDTRWTGVLEKRAGKWLVVQMHFSFASK
jgi:ketosteroid isomerase-like protein